MDLISGMMTYSSFYVTVFLIGPLLGVLSYPRRPVYGRTYTYIMMNWSAASSIRGGNTWVKRHPGYEVPGHPGGGLVGRSSAGWLLDLVPLGYPGGGLPG